MTEEQAKILLGKLMKGVESQYPDDDETRQLTMFKMFLKECEILGYKRVIPPVGKNHDTQKKVRDLKKEVEAALEVMGKNHGEMCLISVLKASGLFDRLNPESVSPSQIEGLKEALEKIK